MLSDMVGCTKGDLVEQVRQIIERANEIESEKKKLTVRIKQKEELTARIERLGQQTEKKNKCTAWRIHW